MSQDYNLTDIWKADEDRIIKLLRKKHSTLDADNTGTVENQELYELLAFGLALVAVKGTKSKALSEESQRYRAL